MKFLLLLAILAVLHKQAWCKPLTEEDEDDYTLQNDDYPDDYDDDSNGDEDNDEPDEMPKFITKPLHLSVKAHSDISLPCDLSGNTATYTIMWKKNNEIIFQEKHIFTSFDAKKFALVNTTTLTIKDVDASDSGEYSCVVIISSDKEEALKHTLTIQGPAKITSLTADKSGTEYKAGDTLELTCSVAGKPEPKISWSLHGKHLGTGSKLIIDNIGHADSGDYQCIADNGIDPVSHHSININVMYAPIIELEKATTNFRNDEYDIDLRCKVRSNPPAIVVWRKDGEEIKKDSRRKNNVHILKLEKVDSKQFGKYSCSAVNQVGKNEQHVMITNAPSKAEYKGEHDVHGKELNMTWQVESMYPITEYSLEYKKASASEWKEEKPEVTNSESGNLYVINYILKNLEGGAYEVRVRSKNQWGWSEYSKTTFKAHNAHHGHKQPKDQHKNKPIRPNEEDNNIAIETRVEGSRTSSSSQFLPSTSLLCLAVFTLFNRH